MTEFEMIIRQLENDDIIELEEFATLLLSEEYEPAEEA